MFPNTTPILWCLMMSGMLSATLAADRFTSLVHLQESIQAESDITIYIGRYIKAEKQRLDQLTSVIGELASHHHELSNGSTEKHVSNPVNAFLLTRRMHELLLQSTELIDEAAKENIDRYYNESEEVRSLLPTQDDVDGAVSALLRLQDTYALETSRLADGNLGLKSAGDEAPPLSGEDCFYIGQTACIMDDFYHALTWLQAALRKYDAAGKEVAETLKENVSNTLNYLSYSLYKQGNLERAIAIASRWTEMMPGVEPGTTNLCLFHKELSLSGRAYTPEHLPPLVNNAQLKGYKAGEEYGTYIKLCQGRQPHKLFPVARQLSCRLRSIQYSYHPSLEEELSLDPRLVFYHHILTDSEIELIQGLSKPNLIRSGVFAANASTPDDGLKSEQRVSKSAWLWDEDGKNIAALSDKFGRITGLTLGSAEPLQVLNYGIGGYYAPHHDFARPDNLDVFVNGPGNRIATLILYLSDVEKGGATVFPRIGAAVWPERGGAAFWYNLMDNGERDYRTLHGACPVLAGYKWVCNKWFHEAGNEFTRPCSVPAT